VKSSIFSLFLLTAFAQPAFAAETITVIHSKVPAPTVIDLGPVGESVGDERIWHFLGTAPDSSTVSIDFIMITTAQSDERCCRTLTVKDSHCESSRLDRRHEQAITRPLPHYELVQLHRLT
jgi:hypothetical protein